MLQVNIMKLVDEAVIPTYAREGDAGLDITCIAKSKDEYNNTVYSTGLAIEIPYGYVGLLFPRSSVRELNLSLANSVGVIDSGFRGEIKVMFKPTVQQTNNDLGFLFKEEYCIGDKVAQLVVIPFPMITLNLVDSLSTSQRGLGGFGHTGK